MLDEIKAILASPHWTPFLWGTFGSIAIEVAAILRRIEQPGKLPTRYKQVWYWAIRTLYALISGGLVVAYGVENPVVAIHIGVATPLIFTQLAKREPSVTGGGGGGGGD